eukprot:s2497_g8.t1
MPAALVPLACSDVSAPLSTEIFATDPSVQKGAIVSKKVSPLTAKPFGLMVAGAVGIQNLTSSLGEDGDDSVDEELLAGPELGALFPWPEKPSLFSFDFVEVCGGAGKVSRSMSALGFVIAPTLGLSNSKRSYGIPVGWDRNVPKVFLGNQLAFRCLILIYTCVRCLTPAELEQPKLSKMCLLAAWKWLLSIGCEEAVVASCYFGWVHRKEPRLLVHLLDAEGMTRKCAGGHSHVQMQGAYAKGTAVYTDQVAEYFAEHFAKELYEQAEELELAEHVGLESVLTNDVLKAGG